LLHPTFREPPSSTTSLITPEPVEMLFLSGP
jgi:hypothetical protein